jgi:hypothetical protein
VTGNPIKQVIDYYEAQIAGDGAFQGLGLT